MKEKVNAFINQLILEKIKENPGVKFNIVERESIITIPHHHKPWTEHSLLNIYLKIEDVVVYHNFVDWPDELQMPIDLQLKEFKILLEEKLK